MIPLEKRGSGIFPLPDLHPATVAAQPGLLPELNEPGFHVVQVVSPVPAAPPGRTRTASAPKAWTLASATPEAAINDDGQITLTKPVPGACNCD